MVWKNLYGFPPPNHCKEYTLDNKLRAALKELECHNGMFRQLWELGRIHFTEEIPTAGVSFSLKDGKYLSFAFNPTFYDSLTAYELAFVISHECMHVLLEHGIRSVSNPEYDGAREVVNVAMDIALHEIMFREFGFERDRVSVSLCDVDSVFKDLPVARDRSFEYYYDQLHKHNKVTYVSLDSHDFKNMSSREINNLIKRAMGNLSNQEKRELLEKIASKIDNKEESTQRGDQPGQNWYDVTVTAVEKRKWEMVIKEWAQSFLREDKYDWTKPSRRMPHMNRNMFMPNMLELEIKRTNVWLFMDTSGSCIGLADRFFSAAASLPKRFFKPRLFCFDTEIYETDLSSKKVYGGGGTSFDIMEDYIQKSGTYPDFVFVITDGYGNDVKPAHPEKWHVFLTTEDKHCFPAECKFHSFSEFE